MPTDFKRIVVGHITFPGEYHEPHRIPYCKQFHRRANVVERSLYAFLTSG